MRASDIAKLAASVATGYITYEAATKLLGNDGDISLLDSLVAGGVAGTAGGIVGGLMDKTGASNLVDDVFGDLF